MAGEAMTLSENPALRNVRGSRRGQDEADPRLTQIMFYDLPYSGLFIIESQASVKPHSRHNDWKDLHVITTVILKKILWTKILSRR
ncbi:hypothetical protein NDU88_003510 [Pleurodeles waltl]|uniref:Uncharacterized protein n=1 Tax=Pleurodeles waltl TaxID=8319 RepID=A0AAV7W5U6_PLEWA|nr:hypothetical protein NDU88_003510 [Pleurodeles waltl]